MLVLGKHKEMMQLIKKWVIEHTSEIPYSGKLSREKTFANWWKIQFSQRKLLWIACFYRAACQRTPRPQISQRKLSRIATKSRNLRKFPTIRYIIATTKLHKWLYTCILPAMRMKYFRSGRGGWRKWLTSTSRSLCWSGTNRQTTSRSTLTPRWETDSKPAALSRGINTLDLQ